MCLRSQRVIEIPVQSQSEHAIQFGENAGAYPSCHWVKPRPAKAAQKKAISFFLSLFYRKSFRVSRKWIESTFIANGKRSPQCIIKCFAHDERDPEVKRADTVQERCNAQLTVANVTNSLVGTTYYQGVVWNWRTHVYVDERWRTTYSIARDSLALYSLQTVQSTLSAISLSLYTQY